MKEFVCIGSGPSLTQDQIDLVYQSYAFVIAVNDNYRRAPWADYLFAADLKWWRRYYRHIVKTVEDYTELVTVERVPVAFERNYKGELKKDFIERKVHRDPRYIAEDDELYHGGNSGMLAVEFARVKGAEKIILIGFDHQHTNDKSHWFGDHPEGFINAQYTDRWIREFRRLSKAYEKKGIDLVNCSIESAIDSVRRSTLEEELLCGNG